jgi:cell wall assembly regulator SMI1
MTFDEARELIRGFWSGASEPFGGGERQAVERLEREFGRKLPSELAEYIGLHAPSRRLSLDTVGNPLDLYAASELGARADGYNWNPLAREPLEGWSDGWLLIGDEGADPVIVDLTDSAVGSSHCTVLQAPHGEGDWDFAELAPSIPELLVLAAAQHHALSAFGPPCDAVVDDARGFNLNETAAAWYFPFVRRVAPASADRWLYVFDNGRE